MVVSGNRVMSSECALDGRLVICEFTVSLHLFRQDTRTHIFMSTLQPRHLFLPSESSLIPVTMHDIFQKHGVVQ